MRRGHETDTTDACVHTLKAQAHIAAAQPTTLGGFVWFIHVYILLFVRGGFVTRQTSKACASCRALHASRHTLIVSTMTVATWRCKLIGRPSTLLHIRKSSKTIVEVLIWYSHDCGVRGGLFNGYGRLFSSVTIVDSTQDRWGACVKENGEFSSVA